MAKLQYGLRSFSFGYVLVEESLLHSVVYFVFQKKLFFPVKIAKRRDLPKNIEK